MKTISGNSTFNFDALTKDLPLLQYRPSFYKGFATFTIQTKLLQRIRHLYNIDQGPEGVLLIHEKKGDCCNSVEALHDDLIDEKNLEDDLIDKKN